MGLIQEKEAMKESARRKHRENAAKRLSLGFNDKGKEEVQDTILEELEYKSREYQKQIEEQKERKPVKLSAEVKAISKKDIENLMLRDEEKFRPIWAEWSLIAALVI